MPPESEVNGTSPIDDITTRDGAIAILRKIRGDTREIGKVMEGFAFFPSDRQMRLLNELCEAQSAQIFALTIMLSGILGDPQVVEEVAADVEVED